MVKLDTDSVKITPFESVQKGRHTTIYVECIPGRNYQKSPRSLCVIWTHLFGYYDVTPLHLKSSQIGRFNCKNIQLAIIKKLYATNYYWNWSFHWQVWHDDNCGYTSTEYLSIWMNDEIWCYYFSLELHYNS